MCDDVKYSGFLETEMKMPRPEDALFHIIPVPYEKSVSYGKGTVNAPSRILAASQQLELFDGTGIPAKAGIYTLPPVDCSGSHETALARVARSVSSVFEMEKIPIMLGGEHTVTYGALLAMKDRSEAIGIIQFDAHADLRDTYRGTPFSHACVMHRALDAGFSIFQIGIRSMTAKEHILREQVNSLYYLDAAEIEQEGIETLVIPESFPEQVYITFDVDVFDPSIMPATGAPEPGGLNWYQTMSILQTITMKRKVIGFDVVELAPVTGLHFGDYTVARMIYNTMGFLSRSPFNKSKRSDKLNRIPDP